MKPLYIIITGTDPEVKKGGISVALSGYFNALKAAGIEFEFIATHSSASFNGKYWYFLKALPVIFMSIINNKKTKRIILYSHPGAAMSLFRQSLILALVKLFKVKSIMQLHAPEVDSYLTTFWKKRLFSLAIINADRLNVLLPWWQTRLLQANINKPISILPNPLLAEWEKIARKPMFNKNNNDNTINILTLSRLESGKGVDKVLEAMFYLTHNFTLTIAGEGRLLSSLKTRTEELGLSNRVTFSGWVSGCAKQQLFEQADIFCLPSSYDSFGMSFLEAMANGLPVVAMNWGPISDIVPDGKVGFLVEHSKPKLLADVINKLTKPEIRKKMGEQGKAWSLDKFSSDNIGRDLKDIFEKLMADNN